MKRDRRRWTRLAFGGLLWACCWGCVKDELHNTPYPDLGTVMVAADWSGRSSDAAVPGTWELYVDGVDGAGVVVEKEGATCGLHDPGKHDLVAFNRAEGVGFRDSVAVVEVLADGTLEPLPGFLFTGTGTVDAVADDTTRVTLRMRQRTRTLELVLKLSPGDAGRVEAVEVGLTGIASLLDVRTGEVPAGAVGTVAPVFGSVTGGEGFAARVRLLGVVAGEKQVLTLAIRMAGGRVERVVTDLTGALARFGDGVEPLVLDATLELPAAGEVGAVIEGWKVVENGEIEVI